MTTLSEIVMDFLWNLHHDRLFGYSFIKMVWRPGEGTFWPPKRCEFWYNRGAGGSSSVDTLMMFWREFWRREWDSNPRKDFRSLTRLAGECLKPTRPSLRATLNYKHLFKKFKFFNLRRWENPPLFLCIRYSFPTNHTPPKKDSKREIPKQVLA